MQVSKHLKHRSSGEKGLLDPKVILQMGEKGLLESRVMVEIEGEIYIKLCSLKGNHNSDYLGCYLNNANNLCLIQKKFVLQCY